MLRSGLGHSHHHDVRALGIAPGTEERRSGPSLLATRRPTAPTPAARPRRAAAPQRYSRDVAHLVNIPRYHPLPTKPERGTGRCGEGCTPRPPLGARSGAGRPHTRNPTRGGPAAAAAARAPSPCVLRGEFQLTRQRRRGPGPSVGPGGGLLARAALTELPTDGVLVAPPPTAAPTGLHWHWWARRRRPVPVCQRPWECRWYVPTARRASSARALGQVVRAASQARSGLHNHGRAARRPRARASRGAPHRGAYVSPLR